MLLVVGVVGAGVIATVESLCYYTSTNQGVGNEGARKSESKGEWHIYNIWTYSFFFFSFSFSLYRAETQDEAEEALKTLEATKVK